MVTFFVYVDRKGLGAERLKVSGPVDLEWKARQEDPAVAAATAIAAAAAAAAGKPPPYLGRPVPPRFVAPPKVPGSQAFGVTAAEGNSDGTTTASAAPRVPVAPAEGLNE